MAEGEEKVVTLAVSPSLAAILLAENKRKPAGGLGAAAEQVHGMLRVAFEEGVEEVA